MGHEAVAYLTGNDAQTATAENLNSRRPSGLVSNSRSESLSKAAEIGPNLEDNLRMNILMQCAGTRGDVQPYIVLGKQLQKSGHRVRLATHRKFAAPVVESGLEYYPIGGDAEELCRIVVESNGPFFAIEAVRTRRFQKFRAMVADIQDDFLESCIANDPATGTPFVADVIVAAPISFAHVLSADALSIPIHFMVPMPWATTRICPHIMMNRKILDMKPKFTNLLSHRVAEWLIWQYFGDIINARRLSLGLEAVPAVQTPYLLEKLKVPLTFLLSPSLFPKPFDWPAHANICGFMYQQPPSYVPPHSLKTFLEQGPPPVSIGFGSMVVQDPKNLIEIILQAVRITGVRAIILTGWSRLRGSNHPNIYYIDECPHEWLFPRVSAVIHHGGAGTTACAAANGRPNAILPFACDQHLWGYRIAELGLGPRPIPPASLTSKKLADAIQYCLSEPARKAAARVAGRIKSEAGAEAAVDHFHHNPLFSQMRCCLLPMQPAMLVYKAPRKSLYLSVAAAQVLLDKSIISPDDLDLNNLNTFVIGHNLWGPLMETISLLVRFLGRLFLFIVDLFFPPKDWVRIDTPDIPKAQNRWIENLRQASEVEPSISHPSLRGRHRSALRFATRASVLQARLATGPHTLRNLQLSEANTADIASAFRRIIAETVDRTQ